MKNFSIDKVNLRGLNNELELISKEANTYTESLVDGFCENTEYFWRYYHKKNGNTVDFIYYSDSTYEDDNDKYLIKIINGIRDSAYYYLINSLNNNEFLCVEWSAIPDTTSDYTIFYPDADIDQINYAYTIPYKYKEVTKNEIKKLKV